ncbi:MAG: UDP-N-acetylmuramate--L-alanine ligase [Elusimicrobia bacterium]|jgi:UDP-N-acetylmuramate--alanine ligase|nr:UDP-N-acetylmuramate--L-alanine ligase [Elusimicrobiota bacterium]
MFKKIEKIYFVGIGGSGMCGIAEVLLNLKYDVSGSDLKESSNVKRLKGLGANIKIGHSESNLNTPHVVVVSSAVNESNPEVRKARKLNIPVIPRAQMLAELMRLKYALCVAGTHGKTTTTSMIGLILSNDGMDPTVVIGGILKNLGSGVKLGDGEFMVAEADESDGSFLYFSPTISIVTNIDNDHLIHYGSMDNLKDTFVKFLNRVPFYGFSVLCADDENIREILPQLNCPYKTYGINANNDYVACDIELTSEDSRYDIKKDNGIIGSIVVNQPGMHNVLNSLAAVVTGLEIGIDFKIIKNAIGKYGGVGRRLEKVDSLNGVYGYDDYAHHPTEIKMSADSLRRIYPDNRIVAVFQPHRYTRTKDLYKEFPESFNAVDKVFITHIYPAGENPIKGVSGGLIASEFKDKNKGEYCETMEDVNKKLKKQLRAGDVFITFGAGNIDRLHQDLKES